MSAEILVFPFMETPPNRVLEFRKAAGLSQEQLGERIGVSKMHVSRIERGIGEITIERLRQIAAVFGVNTTDLLADEDMPERLTDAERALIDRYRLADQTTRDNIQRVAEALSPFRHEDRRAA